MKVTLGTFARYGIEVGIGPDLDRTVELALRRYVSGLRAGPSTPAPPAWLLTPPARGPDCVLELPIDVDVETRLAAAAEALGTDLDCLAGHAVMSYLAELDRLMD